jgi:hypothetical protein
MILYWEYGFKVYYSAYMGSAWWISGILYFVGSSFEVSAYEGLADMVLR